MKDSISSWESGVMINGRKQAKRTRFSLQARHPKAKTSTPGLKKRLVGEKVQLQRLKVTRKV
jgi:hypothetical protein